MNGWTVLLHLNVCYDPDPTPEYRHRRFVEDLEAFLVSQPNQTWRHPEELPSETRALSSGWSQYFRKDLDSLGKQGRAFGASYAGLAPIPPSFPATACPSISQPACRAHRPVTPPPLGEGSSPRATSCQPAGSQIFHFVMCWFLFLFSATFSLAFSTVHRPEFQQLVLMASKQQHLCRLNMYYSDILRVLELSQTQPVNRCQTSRG